ncbi:hypothetical protein TOPH_07383 [Tolypocladium ophioglossoides CBS 100239]|uniref:Uncharacterized protein n=1 Tax=Tolypocladium ophioglossoides (strain CBS 100239) TaxID=1163406 RepID=A0A0L0N1V1_TOLOC|nr:hypothetical protein TOPH_07383 [Tolypocladium ophioglossoides CBS 100239]
MLPYVSLFVKSTVCSLPVVQLLDNSLLACTHPFPDAQGIGYCVYSDNPTPSAASLSRRGGTSNIKAVTQSSTQGFMIPKA